MNTKMWCAACWVLLGLMRMSSTASDQAENCMQLEFDGLGPSDNMVRMEENKHDILHIKISYKDNKYLVDVCKFVISRDCNSSDTSNAATQCRCLTTRVVQFYKKINRSDNRNYTWTWVNTKKPKTEKRREMFITFTSKSTEESSGTTQIAASTCSVFGVVVAVAVGYFVRRRSRCKFLLQLFSN